jgi:hypothetical protein
MRRKYARRPAPLELHRETLRHLDREALRYAAAAGETQDGQCTQVNSFCPIETCTCGLEAG